MAIGCFVVEISQVLYHCHKGFSVSESTSCPKVVLHTLSHLAVFMPQIAMKSAGLRSLSAITMAKIKVPDNIKLIQAHLHLYLDIDTSRV
jgi:hypothetical protein